MSCCCVLFPATGHITPQLRILQTSTPRADTQPIFETSLQAGFAKIENLQTLNIYCFTVAESFSVLSSLFAKCYKKWRCFSAWHDRACVPGLCVRSMLRVSDSQLNWKNQLRTTVWKEWVVLGGQCPHSCPAPAPVPGPGPCSFLSEGEMKRTDSRLNIRCNMGNGQDLS